MYVSYYTKCPWYRPHLLADNDGSYDDIALAGSPLILLTQYSFIDPMLIYLSIQLGGDRTKAAREGELDSV